MDIFDLHCDTLYRAVAEKKPLNSEEMEVQLNNDPGYHKLQCYAVWIPDDLSGDEAERLFRKASDRIIRECDEHHITLITPGMPLRNAFLRNRNTAFFTIENGKALNGKIENVAKFASAGVRMMTLTWNDRNEIGSGVMDVHPAGLTAFGKKVIREMEKHHIVVDISHASRALFDDVAGATTRPFVASHSNAYSVTAHPRNLTDEQFGIIRDRGGLVGINFHNAFLNNKPEQASLNDIIRHIEYFLTLDGENTLCFGNDFDGDTLPVDIHDSRVYDKIYEVLLQNRYKESIIRKILYENALNFFENFDNPQNMV